MSRNLPAAFNALANSTAPFLHYKTCSTFDFVIGHLNIITAIVFKEIEWNFSAGAQKAIAEAKKSLFRDDWKNVFEPAELMRSVQSITQPDNP